MDSAMIAGGQRQRLLDLPRHQVAEEPPRRWRRSSAALLTSGPSMQNPGEPIHERGARLGLQAWCLY